MNNKKFLVSFIFILTLFPITVTNTQNNSNLPIIDGFWSENEWPESIITDYAFVDNVKVKFSYRLNETHLFFTAQYKDDTPRHTGFLQDAFAVGFDNNGDEIFMGTDNSPDDSVFIGFYGNYSIDVYMQGIRAGSVISDDEPSIGGNNDTYGKFSISDDNIVTYEFLKSMDSGDTKGHDISIKKGDSMKIMLAYWDDLPPFDEVSSFTEWIDFRVSDPINDSASIMDYLLPMGLVVAFIVVLVLVRIKTSS